MDDVGREIVRMVRKIADLERRIDSMVQSGPVHSVDPKAGTVRLRLGGSDADPFLSPDIPYAQFAGALKVHTPPVAGQQMRAIFGGGDFRQGLAVPLGWSDTNASPSEKGDENVATYGDWRIALDGEQLIASNGDTTLRLTASDARVKSPKVIVESADVSLGGEGGERVARVGDKVHVAGGSSEGFWPIVEGSSVVTAIG